MNQRLLLLAVAAAVLPGPVLGQGTPARDNIDALIEEQAKANGVPASFVHQVVKRESNYNPNAKGGSALGLMQIKHATARGMGYRGDAAGLYDPKINLRYGIAYLAGAYRTAKGNTHQAYTYYNRGYYYAGKRQGTLVAGIEDTTAASPQSSAAFSDVFTRGFGAQRKAQPDANVTRRRNGPGLRSEPDRPHRPDRAGGSPAAAAPSGRLVRPRSGRGGDRPRPCAGRHPSGHGFGRPVGESGNAPAGRRRGRRRVLRDGESGSAAAAASSFGGRSGLGGPPDRREEGTDTRHHHGSLGASAQPVGPRKPVTASSASPKRRQAPRLSLIGTKLKPFRNKHT